MMLIEHEARVGLPRMWEHPTRTHTRRGGVVASMVGGYTAICGTSCAKPKGASNEHENENNLHGAMRLPRLSHGVRILGINRGKRQ